MCGNQYKIFSEINLIQIKISNHPEIHPPHNEQESQICRLRCSITLTKDSGGSLEAVELCIVNKSTPESDFVQSECEIAQSWGFIDHYNNATI